MKFNCFQLMKINIINNYYYYYINIIVFTYAYQSGLIKYLFYY